MITNYNLTSFEYTSYRIDENITQDELDELIDIFTSASKETSAGIFIINYESKNNLEEVEHLYCSENAKEYVKKAIDGHTVYKSILSGRLSYNICSLEDIAGLNSLVGVYFCGDETNVEGARNYIGERLSEKYSEEPSGTNIYKYIKFVVLGLVILLIAVFNVFDVNIKRKEFVVKCIYGESKYLLISKYFVTDVLLYGGEVLVMFCAISKLNSLSYCLNDVMAFSACMVVGIFLSYIPLFVAIPVYTLKGQESTRKLLSAAHMTKIIISTLIICVISFFITLLIDMRAYIKTADFFEDHSDYYFLYLESPSDRENLMYNRETYSDRNYRLACQYFDICEPILIDHKMYAVYNGQEEGANGYYVFANANAIDYLKSVVKELNGTTINSDYIIVAPKSEVDDKFIQKSIEAINLRYDEYFSNDVQIYSEKNVQIVKTTENYEVFATDNNKTSEMGVFKNEPIIVCTRGENQSVFSPEEMNLETQSYYMFKMTDELKKEIIEKENLNTFVQTNCKEQYDYFWRMNRLGLVYFGAFSVILLVLEAAVLSFVVRSEFVLNKEELCIKKVLGYTLLSRYGEVIAETLITSSICFGVSIFALSRLDTKTPFLIAIVTGIILLLAEFIIIVAYIVRLERRNVQKILKGGAL